MKAIVYRNYGSADVLVCEDTVKPTIAGDQVLIKVHAASVNPLDWHFMHGRPYLLRLMAGLRVPKDPRLGTDVAGQVEAVGPSVTHLKPGDEVFGVCSGAFAEWACACESKLVHRPGNITVEQAAAVPVAAITALQGLRDKGQIQPGQKVLINGAAGGVGTFAVQIAKSFGADVTGVCSTRNMAMVQSIGADQTIDYTQTDFTAGDSRYDLILDCIGNHPLLNCRRILNPSGAYIIVGAPDGRWIGGFMRALKAMALSRFVSQKMLMFLAQINQPDLRTIRDLIASGKVTPVIDRCYPLSEVREAIRYLEASHARGKVILLVAPPVAGRASG